MRKIILVAAGLLATSALVCVGHVVRADNASDRSSLISDINNLVKETADYTKNAGTSSSTSEIDSARSEIGRIKDKLSALARVQDQDSVALSYVNDYPRILEDFDRATQSFRQQKDNQTSITNIPRKCQGLDRQLTEVAGRFESEKDGGRIEELRRTALEAGKQAEEWWQDADRRRQSMVRWSEESRRFASDKNEWPRVTSALQDSATRSLDAWMRDFAELERACKDLRQRDRHPAVERALRALESTAKGKDQIYARLDEDLKRAESAWNGVFGDSSSSRANDARAAIDDLDRQVRDLDNIKGADKKANQIVSTWPDFIKAYAPAAVALTGLKDAQHEFDDVPGRCKKRADELQAELNTYLSQNDPDGLHLVPEEAEKLGEHFRSALATMDAAKPTREHLVRDVAAFEPRDDRWSPLRKQMKDLAEQLFQYWDTHTKDVHTACDDLAKGVRNPIVERFMTELGGKVSSDLKTFQDTTNAWERDARDIYQLDCTDMQDLWDYWCTIEFEPTDPPETAYGLQRSGAIIDRESAKIAGVLAQLSALRTRATELARKSKYQDAIGKIREMFNKQEGRLQALARKNGEWRGMNIPAIQFAAEYGKQAHDRLGGNHQCNVYDKAVPGLGRDRPDCIKVEGKGKCMVYEFKPQGWSGTNPLPAYVQGVQAYYQSNMRSGSSPSSELGGPAFQALVEANCRNDSSKDKKDDTLTFNSDFDYYARCEHRYECTQ